MINLKELQNRAKTVEEVILYADERIKNFPDGALKVRRNSKGTRYYRVKHSPDYKELYLGKKNEKEIKELQEKYYYEEMKKAASKELLWLKQMIEGQVNTKPFEEVFYSIPEDKRCMITPYVPAQVEEIKKKIEKECRYWKKESLIRRGVSGDISLITMNGERVRSKSELIIADRLKAAGVPYYYEGKYIFINDKTNDYEVWFPDFQMYNTRTGELFLWEHFGLMDNSEYCEKCQMKLENYAKHGIIIGKNLIITIESSLHSLNTSYVDKMIENFLK